MESDTGYDGVSIYNIILIGGLEHEFYDFPVTWDFHHPN